MGSCASDREISLALKLDLAIGWDGLLKHLSEASAQIYMCVLRWVLTPN